MILRRFLIGDSIASATAALSAATLSDLLMAPLGVPGSACWHCRC